MHITSESVRADFKIHHFLEIEEGGCGRGPIMGAQKMPHFILYNLQLVNVESSQKTCYLLLVKDIGQVAPPMAKSQLTPYSIAPLFLNFVFSKCPLECPYQVSSKSAYQFSRNLLFMQTTHPPETLRGSISRNKVR